MLSEIFKLFWKTVERKDARRINSQTPPTEIEQFCDIKYIDDGLWQHRLDVYSKSGKLSHRPVIIDIHGGGWMYGTKEINKNYTEEELDKYKNKKVRMFEWYKSLNDFIENIDKL